MLIPQAIPLTITGHVLLSLRSPCSAFLEPLHPPLSPGVLSDLPARDGLPFLTSQRTREPAYIQRICGKKDLAMYT